MKKTSSPVLTKLASLDQIPTSFATEREEAEFWDTHSISDELWDTLEDADPLEIDFSLDPDLATRLYVLARAKGVPCVDLVLQFVAERLYEEEKREGIIGDKQAS